MVDDPLNACAQRFVEARSPALCLKRPVAHYVTKQRWLWQEFMDAQARLSLCCSPTESDAQSDEIVTPTQNSPLINVNGLFTPQVECV